MIQGSGEGCFKDRIRTLRAKETLRKESGPRIKGASKRDQLLRARGSRRESEPRGAKDSKSKAPREENRDLTGGSASKRKSGPRGQMFFEEGIRTLTEGIRTLTVKNILKRESRLRG